MLSFPLYAISGDSIICKACSGTAFHLKRGKMSAKSLKVFLSIFFIRIIGKAYSAAIFHLAVE